MYFEPITNWRCEVIHTLAILGDWETQRSLDFALLCSTKCLGCQEIWGMSRMWRRKSKLCAMRWGECFTLFNSTEFYFWVSNCTGLGYSLHTPIILRQQSTDIVSECFAGHYNYIIISFYFSVPEHSVKWGSKQLQFLLFKHKLATSWDGFNVAEFAVKPRFQTDVIWI